MSAIRRNISEFWNKLSQSFSGNYNYIRRIIVFAHNLNNFWLWLLSNMHYPVDYPSSYDILRCLPLKLQLININTNALLGCEVSFCVDNPSFGCTMRVIQVFDTPKKYPSFCSTRYMFFIGIQLLPMLGFRNAERINQVLHSSDLGYVASDTIRGNTFLQTELSEFL